MQVIWRRLIGSISSMRMVVCSTVLSLFLLTASGVTVAANREPRLHDPKAMPRMDATTASTGPWYIDRIDRPAIGYGADRGQYASIAIRSTQTFVSYYDTADTSLRVAYKKTSGGNCGPGNTWWCEVIDNDGNVGLWNSIAATPGGNTLFGIAYFDATNGALKFASYTCSSGSCTSSAQTIISGIVFMYASTKYDTNGVVHVAFQAIAFGSALMYARSVTSGGNCGVGTAAGKWQCDTIDIGTGASMMGAYASLDLNDGNRPSIAYYDASAQHLKYASFIDVGTGNCGPGNKWQCDTIDDIGNVGRFASLRIPKHVYGSPFIGYYDATNGVLKIATKTGSGGNCGPLSGSTRTWQCYPIANMGTDLNQAGVAIEVVGADEPVIAYMDASDAQGPSVLKVASATRVMAGQTYSHNCGPYPSMFAWWCETIDGGGSWTDEATFVSMAADYNDRLSIAYYESDSYYGTGYVKLAQQAVKLYQPLILK